MKHLAYILSLFLFFNCDNSPEKEKSIELNHEVQNELSKDKAVIKFDPSNTTEEWINIIWSDYFNEEATILNSIEIESDDEEAVKLVFIIEGDDSNSYYTLIKKENDEYELNKVPLTDNSAIKHYGNSSTASLEVFELKWEDIDDNGEVDLIVGTEINGMMEAEDGVLPFTKIQFDILTFTKDQGSHNSKLTTDFNSRYNIECNKDINISRPVYLSQKYFYSLSSDAYDYEKMNELLEELDLTSVDVKNTSNEFIPVSKEDSGDFVIDHGLNFFSCYFITNSSNNFNLIDLNPLDYPIYYVEDHGAYVYRIDNIRVDLDMISITLIKHYHQDENTNELDHSDEENSIIEFHYINNKWVLQYESSFLMMNKDTEEMKVIDSNEGQ